MYIGLCFVIFYITFICCQLHCIVGMCTYSVAKRILYVVIYIYVTLYKFCPSPLSSWYCMGLLWGQFLYPRSVIPYLWKSRVTNISDLCQSIFAAISNPYGVFKTSIYSLLCIRRFVFIICYALWFL